MFYFPGEMIQFDYFCFSDGLKQPIRHVLQMDWEHFCGSLSLFRPDVEAIFVWSLAFGF